MGARGWSRVFPLLPTPGESHATMPKEPKQLEPWGCIGTHRASRADASLGRTREREKNSHFFASPSLFLLCPVPRSSSVRIKGRKDEVTTCVCLPPSRIAP